MIHRAGIWLIKRDARACGIQEEVRIRVCVCVCVLVTDAGMYFYVHSRAGRAAMIDLKVSPKTDSGGACRGSSFIQPRGNWLCERLRLCKC